MFLLCFVFIFCYFLLLNSLNHTSFRCALTFTINSIRTRCKKAWKIKIQIDREGVKDWCELGPTVTISTNILPGLTWRVNECLFAVYRKPMLFYFIWRFFSFFWKFICIFSKRETRKENNNNNSIDDRHNDKKEKQQQKSPIINK